MKIDPKKARNVISKYTAVIENPPYRIPTNTAVDAPLLGNGDVGIAVAGDGSKQCFHICKNDFWVQAHLGETELERLDRLLNDNGRRTGSRIIPVGQLNVTIEKLAGADYRQEQDIFNAELRGEFKNENLAVFFCSWISAEKNILISEITHQGEQDLDISVRIHAGEVDVGEVFCYENDGADDIIWFKYAANPANIKGRRVVAVASRFIADNIELKRGFCTKTADINVKQGKKAYIVTAIISDLDDENYLEAAKKLVKDLTIDKIEVMKTEHRKWWENFWTESLIGIDDPVLEKYYYASNYILACSMRKGKVPPGLFGLWVTLDKPAWSGSYTMNYNYQAPFWGLYGGNHVSLTESYCEPLLDIIPIAKAFAQEKLNCRGVYLPVEIGPWGTVCSSLFHGQKSNGLYSCINLFMHFNYTWNLEYANKVYPFFKEVADFWEDYLVFEDGRYNIYDDNSHESLVRLDKNNILTISMLHVFFEGIITVSTVLGLDEMCHEKWNHILDNIVEYPLQVRNGKQVFRYAESGMEWCDTNTIGIQPIFPVGQIGLGSKKELLQIARNTFDVMNRWDDYNGFPTWYTAAVRIGYEPKEILSRLKVQCEKYEFPNLWIYHGGGGIEDCSAVPTCIQEMLLQSHENILRLFHIWPDDRAAYFCNLRAYGAFLITSSYQSGQVQFVIIESERGRDCTVQNPWPEKMVTLYRNGEIGEALEGEYITFATKEGESIALVPQGITYEQINDMKNA